MSRVVLLVEPDVDVLGALASKLRARGLDVAIADDVSSAIERGRSVRIEAVLVSGALPDALDVLERLRREKELANAPGFLLIDDARPDQDSLELPRGDADAIAKRMHALPSRAESAVAEGGDVRGDLQQVSIVDLLQLLSMNRRSGTLSISTPLGAGEVRLAQGEVVDAVYRRLEGEKALFRLLAETEGAFSFVSGPAQALKRIETATRMLLFEGMRHIDEIASRRERLALLDDALLAVVPPPDGASEIVQRLLETLTTPRTLEEVLDEVAGPDLHILEALAELLDGGEVRRIPSGAVRIDLADAERMTVLAALAKRVARTGFRGPPRLGFAASPQKLVTLMHATGRIADSSVPFEMVPTAPVPHQLATLRLGENVELGVVGIPLVEAYAPLWSLVLPSCAAVGRVEFTASEALDKACSIAGVPVVDAGAVLRDGDESDPEQVAALIRLMLERAAGT